MHHGTLRWAKKWPTMSCQESSYRMHLYVCGDFCMILNLDFLDINFLTLHLLALCFIFLSIFFLSIVSRSLFCCFFASVCRECRIRRKWLWPTPVVFLTHAFVIVKFTFVINGVISPISTWPSSILVVSQRVPSRLSKMDVCVESHWGLLSLKSSLNFCNGSIQKNYGNFQWNLP